MYVLVACEESQEVCKAFRKLGVEAFSCDIQEPSGGFPQYHIQEDVLNILEGGEITTLSGDKYFIDAWDLIIAHPPCTYLTVAGAALLPKHPERIEKGFQAKDFFMKFYNCSCKHVCIENPVPMRVFELPKYSQIVYPYNFGELYKKKICLWLKNLPNLEPTKVVDKDLVPMYERIYKGKKKTCSRWYNGSSAKKRSKTFPGIAQAMAEQWTKFFINK